jgi:hypothetical protein
MEEAGRTTGIRPDNIRRVLIGKKGSTGGYEWYYA